MWLTLAVINGEKAAMHAPDFRQRFAKTRDTLLRDIVDTIQSQKKKSTLLNFHSKNKVKKSPSNSSSKREEDSDRECNFFILISRNWQVLASVSPKKDKGGDEDSEEYVQ